MKFVLSLQVLKRGMAATQSMGQKREITRIRNVSPWNVTLCQGIQKMMLMLMVAVVKWTRVCQVERNLAAELPRSMIFQLEVSFGMLCTYVFWAPSPRSHQDQGSNANLISHQILTVTLLRLRKREDFIFIMILELSSLKGTQTLMKARYVAIKISPGYLFYPSSTILVLILYEPVRLNYLNL